MRGWDAGSCEVSTLAVNGVVEMLDEGIVDDAHEGLELVGEGEGNGNVGMGVHEICSTIYWVDNEGWSRGKAARCGGFFT